MNISTMYKPAAYLYKMPNCKTCKKIEPIIERICEEQGIPLVDISLQDIREKDLEDLALHGLPTLRWNKKQMYKDFTEESIKTFLSF